MSWFNRDQWSGYVAAALLSGQYNDLSSIPAVTQPTATETAEVSSLANHLVTQYNGALSYYTTSRRREKFGQRMEGSLTGLGRHTLPLSEQSDAGTIQKAKELLEPLRARTADLDPKEMSGLPPNAGEVDRLVLMLSRWFKHEYFKWVDPIKCPLCGGETGAISVHPNAEERLGGAGRCELHTCKAGCGGVDRFPRYNEVKALMGSQRGRCGESYVSKLIPGEFAQVFYFFLLVLGVEARYVWNSEDHVWTEYWSPELGHWVHVDSCEAEVNKPLLYSRGWGKQQAYVLAFGRYGAEDITGAYTDDEEANERFRLQKTYYDGSGIEERQLRYLLLKSTVKSRALLDEEERLRLLSMDEAQARWMSDRDARWEEAERVNLRGRDSGTKEWKEARGEAGEGADTDT